MINQQEAAIYLEQELMEQSAMMQEAKGNIYQCMRQFLTLTAEKIKEHNYNAAARCFKVAEALYEQGNIVVRNTIENVFVYSFSSLLHMANNERKELISVIPGKLYAAYLNQACHKGY